MKRNTHPTTASPLIAMIAGLAISAAGANAQDTLTTDGFEGDGTGSLGNWTAAGNAFLKEDAALATTGDFSAELYSGGTITTTDPLPLGSKGYTSMTFTVSAKWLNGSTTRRFEVRYAADGVNFVKVADADIGDTDATVPTKTPTTVTLTVGGGITATNVNSIVNSAYSGEPFTDQAKFQIFYSSNSTTHRVYLDDISIIASPGFSGSYWDIDGATAGAGGATPSGTWNALNTLWSPSSDGDVATAAWTPGQAAVFSAGSDATGAYTVTVDGTQAIGGLSFKDGTPTLTGGTLSMTSDSFAFVDDGLTATIASSISDDAGTRVLSRTGAGTLVLSGSNGSASGSMALNSGITRFDSPASIPGSGENLTINSSGILAFGGSFDATSIQTALNERVVTTSAGTIAVDGNSAVDFDFATAGLTAAYLGAINDTTYTGLLTPNGTTYRLGGGAGKLTLSNSSGMDEASPTIQVLGNVEISGDITGFTGTLTKQGSGTLTLSGANSYAANTTASAGTLVLSGSNNQATQTTINAATVQLASNSNGGLASGQITMNNNSAVLQAVDEDRTIGNEVLLNASPAISGPQSLTINGALTINNNRQLNNNIVSGESLTLAGQINLSNDDTARTLTLAGTGATSVSGNIVNGGTGAGNLTKGGAGVLALSGTNIYSGTTTNGFNNPAHAGFIFQGMQALSPNTTLSQTHSGGVGGHGIIRLLDDSATPDPRSGVNLIFNHSNNSKNTMPVFVGNNSTANGGTSASTQTGSIIQLGNMNFNQTSTGQLAGTALAVTGADDYKLRIGDVNVSLMAAFAAAWPVELRAGAPLIVGGNVQQAAGSSGTTTLQLGGTASGNQILGEIKDSADVTPKVLDLVKLNTASVWTLEGDNSYTGTTTVSGGTLIINGDQSAATGAVAVNGTATLGGSGTLGGAVTVAATANLAPGASVGTLSIGGGLDISALAGGAGLLDFELGPIASSDRVAVTGTLTIGTGALGLGDFNLTTVGGLEEGVYTLITSGGISGTLDAGDLEGTIGATDVTLGTSGGNIILTVGTPSGTPYELWAGPGVLFDGDENGDGVSNGLAFLLGAADPDADALGLLPSVTETAGGLVMTFDMLDAASRGTATLSVEHSSDLGITDAWTTVAVPDSNGGPTSGVTFAVSGSGTLDVTATIGSSEASGGKLFGRLKATE